MFANGHHVIANSRGVIGNSSLDRARSQRLEKVVPISRDLNFLSAKERGNHFYLAARYSEERSDSDSRACSRTERINIVHLRRE